MDLNNLARDLESSFAQRGIVLAAPLHIEGKGQSDQVQTVGRDLQFRKPITHFELTIRVQIDLEGEERMERQR